VAKRGRKRKYAEGVPERFKCSRCKRELPSEEFYRCKTSSGLHYVCKSCNTDVVLEQSCRRRIRLRGAKAFQQEIERVEYRLKVMKKTLRDEIKLRRNVSDAIEQIQGNGSLGSAKKASE